MKTLKLGWQHLLRSERVMLAASTIIGVGLSYLATKDGHDSISKDVILPLVLMWVAWQSTLTVGIIRMRSFALNHVFVETLEELRKTSREVPQHISDLIAGFLGDKK